MVSSEENTLLKGGQLNERICALSAPLRTEQVHQRKLVLSSHHYCVLIEVAALLGQRQLLEGQALEEFLAYEELIFDTGMTRLVVEIDYLAPPESLKIQ